MNRRYWIVRDSGCAGAQGRYRRRRSSRDILQLGRATVAERSKVGWDASCAGSSITAGSQRSAGEGSRQLDGLSIIRSRSFRKGRPNSSFLSKRSITVDKSLGEMRWRRKLLTSHSGALSGEPSPVCSQNGSTFKTRAMSSKDAVASGIPLSIRLIVAWVSPTCWARKPERFCGSHESALFEFQIACRKPPIAAGHKKRFDARQVAIAAGRQHPISK